MLILVAEDDPAYQKVFTTFIRRLGHEPLITNNGEEAWRAFEERHPRIVVSDWMMPELTGVELTNRIRALSGEASRPYIILVTSLSEHERVLEGFRAGADDYVAKPFDHSVLEARINAATDRARAAISAEEKLHRDVVSKFQSALGHEHPELAQSLDALSRIYLEQRVFAKARAFLRRQIDIATKAGDVEGVRKLRTTFREVQEQEDAAMLAAPEQEVA